MEFGSLFDGKYRIIKSLGCGGSGHVYLAENTRVGNLWAIKEIEVGKENNASVESEIEVLMKIRHPALPRIADVIRENNRVYIVEDYIEGRTAAEFIEDSSRRVSGNGRGVHGSYRVESDHNRENVKYGEIGHGVDGNIALGWAVKICDIMRFLHCQFPTPIVYRDLKPSNIIITPDGEVCLVDFGSVRLYKAGGESDTVYIGTRGYAAPEQYGTGQTSVQTDVYSFGMTMLHILSGDSPTAKTEWADIIESEIIGLDRNAAVKVWLILQKCTMTRAEDRYRDFGEVKSDFTDALAGAGNTASVCAAKQLTKVAAERVSVCAASESTVGLCRCLTMSVVKNHEFAFELASCASGRYGCRVLIIDLDFETSLTARYFHKNGRDRASQPRYGSDAGLLSAIDIVAKLEGTNDVGTIAGSGGLSGLTEQSPTDPKVFLLYESDPVNGAAAKDRLTLDGGKMLWRILCEYTTRVDLCLLLTGESVFSNLNLFCFRNSHYIVCPDKADIPSVLTFNNRASLAERLGGVPAGRVKFVLWEPRFGEGTAACETALWELPEQALAGSVRHSKKRDAARNCHNTSERKCYAACMEKTVINDYNDIIKAFRINEIS